jgi:hypothetical protein
MAHASDSKDSESLFFRKYNSLILNGLSHLLKTYPKYNKPVKSAFDAASLVIKGNPDSFIPASRAKPLFLKFQKQIEARDEKLFTQKNEFTEMLDIDMAQMWKDIDHETHWSWIEDQLDVLMDWNDYQEKKKSTNELAISDSKSKPKSKPQANVISTSPETEKEVQTFGTKTLDKMSTLLKQSKSPFYKDFHSLQDNIAKMATSAKDQKDVKTDPKESPMEFALNLVNSLAEDDETEDETLKPEWQTLSEKEKEARLAAQNIQKMKRISKLKYLVGNALDIESLKEIRDPSLLSEIRKEAEEQKKLDQDKKLMDPYSLSTHVNFSLIVFVEWMLTERGHAVSTKTGKPFFPELKEAYDYLLEKFKEQKSRTDIPDLLGAWVKSNAELLSKKKEELFTETETMHPVLKWIQAPLLWKTFDRDSKDIFWSKAQRLLQLTKIYFGLKDLNFAEATDVINRFLTTSKVSYDSPASSIQPRKLFQNLLLQAGLGNNLELLSSKIKDEKDMKEMMSKVSSLLDGLIDSSSENGKDDEDDVEDPK